MVEIAKESLIRNAEILDENEISNKKETSKKGAECLRKYPK